MSVGSDRFSGLRAGVGWLLLLVGFSVFAIRLQHAGPYAVPAGGNLLSGVLSLVLGVWFVGEWATRSGVGRVANGILLVGSPALLFFALYATLAELEEVVVLRAPDRAGVVQNLRLWVVDYDDATWVSMPRSKALEHGLDDADVELVREGEARCVHTVVVDERVAANRTFEARYERYRVQRLATAIGVFGTSAGPDVVTVRLDECSEF